MDEKGRVQLHFPLESVQLIMIREDKPRFREGHLYAQRGGDDDFVYEEYHRLTEAGQAWETLEGSAGALGNCRSMRFSAMVMVPVMVTAATATLLMICIFPPLVVPEPSPRGPKRKPQGQHDKLPL